MSLATDLIRSPDVTDENGQVLPPRSSWSVAGGISVRDTGSSIEISTAGELSYNSGTAYTLSDTFTTTNADAHDTLIYTNDPATYGAVDVTVWAAGVHSAGPIVTLTRRSLAELLDDGTIGAFRVSNEVVGTDYDGITVGGLTITAVAAGSNEAIAARVTGVAATNIDWSVKVAVKFITRSP